MMTTCTVRVIYVCMTLPNPNPNPTLTLTLRYYQVPSYLFNLQLLDYKNKTYNAMPEHSTPDGFYMN